MVWKIQKDKCSAAGTQEKEREKKSTSTVEIKAKVEGGRRTNVTLRLKISEQLNQESRSRVQKL